MEDYFFQKINVAENACPILSTPPQQWFDNSILGFVNIVKAFYPLPHT
jgi:hypothetical protein